MTNSILWGNGLEEIYVDESSTLVVSYSNVQGGWLGTANIDADPLFVDPTNDNYRLSSGSPGIDAGDNLALPEDVTTDLSGGPRFLDDPDTPDTGNPDPDAPELPIVDMGRSKPGLPVSGVSGSSAKRPRPSKSIARSRGALRLFPASMQGEPG